MASRPTDVRWPPGENVDFQSVFERLMTLKRQHFPEHTARDHADPLIQILRLVAALGQHALIRANHALKQLNLKSATSRRALIALMEIVNRPLRPTVPARGYVYATLVAAPVVSTVVIDKGTRIVKQTGSTDPVFTVDSDVSTSDSVAFFLWHQDLSTGNTTAFNAGNAVTDDEFDSFIIGFQNLSFDAVSVNFSVAHTGEKIYCAEYYNEEWGSPDQVTQTEEGLEFVLTEYLHGDTVDPTVIAGLSVIVKYKPSNTVETVNCEVEDSLIVAKTSQMGQSSPSVSVDDYEILAEWRPIPSHTDGTSGLTANGTVSFTFSTLRSSSDWWEQHDEYGYAIRLRMSENTSGTLPENVTISSVMIGGSGNFYATAAITQGYLSTFSLEQTDGSAFQLIPITSILIEEPVEDPSITIEIGGDTDWTVVDDLSNSGPTSKHAIVREDVDLGWCLMLGDNTIGILPDPGSSVKITFRTGSSQPGDLDAVPVKATNASGLVRGWVLPRGTTGYMVPEASTAADVARFRAAVIPQLSLRAESVVTSDEITTALSGGAPNRATFETSDGRTPFSRALCTSEGAGDRQYVVVVVGSETDDDGTVSAADLTEAQEWLNGVSVGIQMVGGHGPQNTEAIVGSFVAHSLIPIITVTTLSTTGVREVVDQIVRATIKPHSRNTDGTWRWKFGGSVPVAVLFGRLWDAIPGRTMISMTIQDAVDTYGLDESVPLETTELPTLDESWDMITYVTIVEG